LRCSRWCAVLCATSASYLGSQSVWLNCVQLCTQNKPSVVVLCCLRVQGIRNVTARDDLKIEHFVATVLCNLCILCTIQVKALHIHTAACAAHVPMLKHVILISLTSGTKWQGVPKWPGHIKLGKKGRVPKVAPFYYYFNNFIVIILFLCIRQLKLTNMIFLLRWCGLLAKTNINMLIHN